MHLRNQVKILLLSLQLAARVSFTNLLIYFGKKELETIQQGLGSAKAK